MVNVRQKGEGAIIGSLSHVYGIERGGMSAIGNIHPIVVPNNPDGTLNLHDIEYAIPPESMHFSSPKVICLESSHNNCNGRVLRTSYIKKVKEIASKNKLRMHLDGARSLNAAAFLNISPAEMVADFDTVNCCLSKGMGCPIGSLIIGTKEDIAHAKIIRKLIGG